MLLALLAGCGGDGHSSVPSDVLTCVTDAGLHAKLKPVSNPGPSDPTTYLVASVERGTIAVGFFAEPSALAAYVDSEQQAAMVGSRNETQETGRDTAVTTEGIGITDEQRDIVYGCL